MEFEDEFPIMDSLEQSKQCWKEYVEFGEDSVFRLSCDFDDPRAMQFLLDAFQNNPHHRPTELELDLCTFQDDDDNNNNKHDSNDNGHSLLLLKLMELMQLLPLKIVEVENRLLDTPWNPQTVSLFLEHGHLHRLQKLVLYGVDLCGSSVGTSFQRLLQCPAEKFQLTELLLYFCPLDPNMLTFFCQGLKQCTGLEKLALYEGGIDDNMLEILVNQGLSFLEGKRACQLHTLNLGRNQLTFPSLSNLAHLLKVRPKLEFLSLFHNAELFRSTDGALDVASTAPPMVVDRPDEDDEPATDKSESSSSSSSPLGLTRRRPRQLKKNQDSPEQLFWKSFQNHTRLLHLWVQAPGDTANNNANNHIEERARPVLLRNQWLSNVTSNELACVLWPSVLVACAAKTRQEACSVVFAFLRFRIEPWIERSPLHLQQQQQQQRPSKLKHA